MKAEEVASKHWQWATNALRAANRDIDARDASNAVSRSYYAMLHAANAVLATKGLQANSHGRAQALFNKHLVQTGEIAKERGRDLAMGQKLRHSADYNVQKSVRQETGEEQCTRARHFLLEIRERLRKEGVPEKGAR